MSLWTELGYSDNPYSTKPIPPNEHGARLLVGRDPQLSHLIRYIESSDTHPTIEGANGVGKTSLTAIASYNLLKKTRGRTVEESLYIPMSEVFQPQGPEDIANFNEKFIFSLAQNFLDNLDIIKPRITNMEVLESIDRWLNDPVIKGGGAGFGVGFSGANLSLQGSGTSSANTTSGFQRSGLSGHLKTALRQAFPTRNSGGFVCVLDNLELLDTSKAARSLLEAMRDDILNFPGVRWVLCGARGIVRSVASSPRLTGVLADPINLGPISTENVLEVISRRITEYKISETAYVPVEPDGFKHIYEIGNNNLRNALKYSQDFVMWQAHNKSYPSSAEEKMGLIEAWFAEMADSYESDLTSVKKRAWEVFDGVAESGGSISPSDYADFNFESSQAMRPHIKSLEDAGLIESSIDEEDNRRKTITVSSKGWIVRYKKLGYRI